ncbi:trinucleotide repeat-containing protein [Anaeramoeba flamelloides]|uniref:Trinucleotide repeat-containing protein n=1 Tax=Anaeramoeba flamelloides TaxID=1746091 RepID=A0AAV8AC63_9EUKA|nr:trinucleotide repeat-containing protein [Anaeramoeba flamelloides]
MERQNLFKKNNHYQKKINKIDSDIDSIKNHVNIYKETINTKICEINNEHYLNIEKKKLEIQQLAITKQGINSHIGILQKEIGYLKKERVKIFKYIKKKKFASRYYNNRKKISHKKLKKLKRICINQRPSPSSINSEEYSSVVETLTGSIESSYSSDSSDFIYSSSFNSSEASSTDEYSSASIDYEKGKRKERGEKVRIKKKKKNNIRKKGEIYLTEGFKF